MVDVARSMQTDTAWFKRIIRSTLVSRAVVNSSYFLSSTKDFTRLSHRENDS